MACGRIQEGASGVSQGVDHAIVVDHAIIADHSIVVDHGMVIDHTDIQTMVF